ncbi:MAG: LuxR C-terminal-related transcriptional regulator [Alphaproteobacteria bacterium]
MKNDGDCHTDNDLISLAYAMAVEPQKLEQMMGLLDARFEHHLDKDNMEPTATDQGHDLADHFERAMSLLDRHSPKNSQTVTSKELMDFDYRPNATISKDGTFQYTNQSAQKSLNWESGQRIKDAYFDVGEFSRFMEGLKKLETSPHGQFIGLYTVLSQAGDNEDIMQIALSGSLDDQGNTVGRLSTLHIKVTPEIAQEFQDALNLTPTEFAITHAIISGQSLADIAKTRQRSLATVRTQLKGLLSKLNLHSQVELACFYSGFAQFSTQQSQKKNLLTLEANDERETFLFPRPDGRQISYDIVGPADGRPVIYFHPLGGGTSLTKSVLNEIKLRNIKLIMPWRPHFSDSTPVKPFAKGLTLFAEDILALMDELNISNCTFLACVSGAIWAYVAAAHCANRVSHITTVAGAVPLSGAHMKMIDMRQRSGLQIARHAPSLLPFAMRAAVAKIDAGYDQEFMQEHYKNAPLDLAFTKLDEIKKLNRVAHAHITKHGHMSLVQEVNLMGQKWDHLMQQVTCPVTILQGEQDPSFPPAAVEAAIRNRGNFTLEVVEGAAQLLLFQNPKRVFETVEQNITSMSAAAE